jgi:hypothetical protein
MLLLCFIFKDVIEVTKLNIVEKIQIKDANFFTFYLGEFHFAQLAV